MGRTVIRSLVGWTSMGGLKERGRGGEAGPDRNDEIENAEHVPARHEGRCVVRRPRIGNSHNRRQETDGDVADACGPSEQRGNLPVA